jgi:hypothetical protein
VMMVFLLWARVGFWCSFLHFWLTTTSGYEVKLSSIIFLHYFINKKIMHIDCKLLAQLGVFFFVFSDFYPDG